MIATRIVWLLDCIAYFFADVGKPPAGPEWVFSDNVKILLYRFWSDRGGIGSGGSPPRPRPYGRRHDMSLWRGYGEIGRAHV